MNRFWAGEGRDDFSPEGNVPKRAEFPDGDELTDTEGLPEFDDGEVEGDPVGVEKDTAGEEEGVTGGDDEGRA